MATLDRELLDDLRVFADSVGLLRLGATRLDRPELSTAADVLDAFVADGRHGEMEFLARTRAVRRDPAKMLTGARSALVAVAPYGGGDGPIARYARYSDYHTDLHRRMERVEELLRTRCPGIATQICVDTKPVMERALAALAGVGTLGKNGCLIVPGLGSYVVIASLLTDGELPADPAPATARDRWEVCGSCRLCLDACPTDAFLGPGSLDARRCISYLTIEHRGSIEAELADRMGERIAGCDVCQEVCPHNASDLRPDRAPEAAWLQPPRHGFRDVDYSRLFTLGSSPHRAFVRDTPLNRIPRRSLRRNALLALANAERPPSVDELSAARTCLDDPDEQVVDAARRLLARSNRTG